MASPQIVLMTGSSAGIGLATAVLLANDPDKRFLVIATVISFAEQDDLVAALGDALDKTVFIKELDITKDDQIKTVVEEVIKEHGRMDILLNIAGIAISGLAESMSRGHIDLTFNINTIGVIRLTQAVLPHMKRRKAGKIITITSIAGRRGTPYLEVYCASKFATEGFLESLAPVARQFNIWVSMVEPIFVKTDLAKDIFSGIEETATDDSVNDDDRRMAGLLLDFAKSGRRLAIDEVTSRMMEIVDAEKPVLRYQVPSDVLHGRMAEYLSDVTGEKWVDRNVLTITGDK